MRVVFMGTPAFAVPTLDVLLRDHDVAAVYTRPDAASGRGRRVVFPPVKERAIEAGVPVEQPVTLRGPEAAGRLAAYAPEVVVVAAYGLILPQTVLDVPALGCVNVHASLLPRWRGAAPVQRAILAGDDVTGVSIMRMEAGLDTGPYALQASLEIGGLDAGELTARLARLGAGALAEYLAAPSGTMPWVAQDDALATYADKVTAADVALAPELSVADVVRRVRASTRSAPARAMVGGRRIVVLDCEPAEASPAQGEAGCSRDLVLGLADGAIVITRLVPEGKQAMAGADWLRGARLPEPCVWSAP